MAKRKIEGNSGAASSSDSFRKADTDSVVVVEQFAQDKPSRSARNELNDNSSGKFWPVAGWIAWIVAAFLLANIVVAIGVAIFLYTGILSENWFADTTTITVVNTIVYVMILLIAVLPWWIMQRKSARLDKKSPEVTKAKKRKDLAELVGLSRWPNLGDLKKFLTFAPIYYVVLLMASLVLTIVLTMALGGQSATEILGQEQNVGYATTGQNVWQLILIGFTLVLVAPVAEEMLMRGLLFGRLRKYLSFWPTAIIVSLVFALAHGQINAGVMTFILSMFACGLREKTGAIWAGIWLHMLVNGVAFGLRFVVGMG